MPKRSAPGAAPSTPAAFRAVVSGRVQGVGFRWSARQRAEAFGLSGWVRNLDDGSVETWAEGSPAALAAYRAWLAKGPAHADVEKVAVQAAEARGYAGFEILD
jgi:acylphosphatase